MLNKQNQIQIFNFEAQEIKTIEIDNQIWFIARNICDILDIHDSGQAIERIDEDEKLTRKLYVSGQERNVYLINESGLYTLILRSNKPEAKKFKKWITKEVLPSIRKTGSYSIQNTLPTMNADFLLEIATKMKTLEEKTEKQEILIEKHISIDKSKNYTEIAKLLQISPLKFINSLRKDGYIRSNREPYQRYIDLGYFTIKKTIKEEGNAIKHFESYRITDKGYQYFVKKHNKKVAIS